MSDHWSKFVQYCLVFERHEMTQGQKAYEAYCNKTEWKSLATGADLPRWNKLSIEIQEAWEAAAAAVRVQHSVIDFNKPNETIVMPMVMRDWFAAMAMSSLLKYASESDAMRAARAYQIADEMIEARSTDRPNDAA